MSKLDELRERLRQMENASSNFGDKVTYPFWDMNFNESAHVRFLPDGNEENPFFWVEKQMIRLVFPGIKGKNEDEEVVVMVPCMEMWGGSCPVLAEVRPWFKDPSLEELGRKYWKKRTQIFQGFVIKDPLNEGDDAPENPIRKFSIGNTLFSIIKASLLDPEMEHMPTDYDEGTNFVITRTQKGKFADYSTSKWARKETALTQDQLDAINNEEFGLKDLSLYLPKKPTDEEVDIIYDMFKASVNEDLYDPDKWAKYYRPFGMDYDEESSGSAKKVSTGSPAVDMLVEDAAKDEALIEKDPRQSADDIINMIRNRSAEAQA